MYSYIKGTIEEKTETYAVIEANGIGYEIFMSNNALSSLPIENTAVKIYTYLYVREDAMQLFGFISKEEKEMFMSLITVSGIGAKSALQILSGLDLSNLKIAIYNGDVDSISKIKGIGRKTAERLVLELKGKIDEPIALFTNNIAPTNIMQEAIFALTEMGLTKFEATQIVQKVASKDDSLETIITKSLRSMG